jgi:hypothetical protein
LVSFIFLLSAVALPMQELGQRLRQLVMQLSFIIFYQIYGKLLIVRCPPKLTPNEQGLAFVATDLSVSPATEAWFYCIVQI